MNSMANAQAMVLGILWLLHGLQFLWFREEMKLNNPLRALHWVVAWGILAVWVGIFVTGFFVPVNRWLDVINYLALSDQVHRMVAMRNYKK